MKKFLALLLILAELVLLMACIPIPDPEPHVCNFELTETTATCLKGGNSVYKCVCGNTEERVESALGHDIGDPAEASRFAFCSREGCTMCTPAFPESGKYSELLVFTFGDEEKAELEAKHEEMLAILDAADDYNPELHGYAESGELHDKYTAAETVYEEYSDLVYAAMDQYSIAMTLYYCNDKDEAYETAYNDMADYYTNLVSKYYTLSQPWYDSMYRDFFFYGATEEEILAFLFDSNALANPEYAALKERNTAIELEYNSIADPTSGSDVLTLYEEMVENNNRLAELLGYDNYLEYAYENVYSRDYSYQDVAAFTEYVKEYIAPIYNSTYTKLRILLSNGSLYKQSEIDEYYSIVWESFFENQLSNELFNDYIDEMEMGFTSNPEKAYSFSDALNGLCADGNLFRGTYEGAYVTYLYSNEIPIAYFGANGYDTPITVSHEFGHYMNEIYNKSEYEQSYDLMETHSQGDEMLFMFYLKDRLSTNAYRLSETYQMYATLSAVISALRVDAFEQAVYLNTYDGSNADTIMADGKIDANDYDLLYRSIGKDFGISAEADDPIYWRYGMTITSPCYYVSYSVSAINALQLYAKCHTDGFDAAKESYLKLFTYTDEDPEMNIEEVLEYAGLLSYNDEQTYKNIAALFK